MLHFSSLSLRRLALLGGSTAAVLLGSLSPADAFGLGAASNYNVFVFGNMSQQNADAEGRVAVGGNASFTNFGIGDRLPAGNEARLVVGGNLQYTRGQLFGGVGIHAGTATLQQVNGTFQQGSAIDFAAAKQELTNLSADLAALTPTGTTTYETWGGIQLNGKGSNLAVFLLDGAKLSTTNFLKIDADPLATVIINVLGDNITLSNFGIDLGSTRKQNLLFNFFEATKLASSGFTFPGSVLAPKADYSFNNGNIEGTLIANSVSGTGEFHNYTFEGDLPSGAVPEPTTMAGLALAGGGLAALRRKRQK